MVVLIFIFITMKSSITDKIVGAHKTTIEDLLTNLEGAVNPNAPVLDTEGRRKYGIGGGNVIRLLIDDVATLAKTQPQLCSTLIDWNEFNTDNMASNTLKEWISRLNAIVYKLESAKMMHDYDNYNDAIDQYAHLQYLSRNNVQGANEAYSQLRSHFKKTRASKEKEAK